MNLKICKRIVLYIFTYKSYSMLSQMNIKQPISKSVSTKLAEQEYNRINELVNEGLFLNSADFVREAIREKLKTYDEVVVLREIPYIQMKQEIIEYVKKHPEVDAVDIADDLLLDAFEVNDILVELIKEGILGEV